MSRSNHRRLFAAAVLFISLAIGGRLHAADSIALENTKPGTTAWQLTNPASMAGVNSTNASVYATPEIQGYASRTSVNQGETINFYVRTINTNSYALSIYRIGWYGGSGGRLMQAPITLTGVVQPMPPPPVLYPGGDGQVECNWSVSYSLTIPTDWVSGVYLVKLSLSAPAKESYIIFVVRDDARNAPILVQASFATYQAYNEWGGSSLYTRVAGTKTGYKVSFNRPFWRNYGAGDFVGMDGNPGYEIHLVRWLEKQGYDATYATDLDTHQNGSLLLSHKAFLVAAHDEYWSWSMRDNVERGRDAGVHVGFLGANACYWQVRFEPSAAGDPDRTMVGYKELASLDHPADPRFVTTLWRDLQRPEGMLMGVQYNGASDTTPSDIVVTNASHWLFNGTGLSNGSILPNVLGYETDSLYPQAGATGVAHSPFPKGAPQVFGDMSLYTAPSGANVFATGTIWWSTGLDAYPPSRGVVPAVQQVTANFLSRALQSTPQPLSITVSSLPDGTMGAPYSSVLVANGGAPPYSWSLASGTLPAGLTLSSAGVISGTPSESGSFSFTAAVTDSSSPAQSATQALTLSIAPSTPPPTVGRLAATVTTSSAASGYPASYAGDGNTATQWVASLNGNDSNNNNSWIRLDFGARVSLQSVKWHGAVANPYPAWSPTNYSIQVSDDGISWQTVITRSNSSPVVDGNEALNAQARFMRMLTSKVGDGTGWSLSFFEFWAEGSTSTQPPPPLSIATSTLPAGTVGVAYDTTLAATGGTLPYAWSIASGALPPGLALGASGRIAGTPSTAGSFTLTFQVSDSGAPTQSATGSFTISVGLAPLAITTTSLAGGTVGVAYNSALVATGGTTPYAWSIASGALPAGLTLSSAGVISGTPSQSGTLSFTAAVTDSSSPAGTATKALSLSVAAVPPPSGRLQTFATSASSAASGYPAARATDLNANTSWVASLDGTKSSNNNAWLQWDLGSTKQIDRVKWTGAVGSPYPAFSPTNYYIQVSDDAVSWRTIVTRSNPSPVINGNENMNAQGRYVRFTSTKVNDGTGWSLSFFEIWAEGR